MITKKKNICIVFNKENSKLLRKTKTSVDWNRILEDKNISCIYSEKTRIAHDKTCRYAKTIDEKNIKIVKKFPDRKYTYCKICGKTGILRSSVDDVENLNKYVSLFKDIPTDTLFKIFIKSGASACWKGSALIMFCRHDYWKIVPKGRKIVLYHNSYTVNGLGERIFTGEWHLQAGGKIDTIDRALNKIYKYNFKAHQTANPVRKYLYAGM